MKYTVVWQGVADDQLLRLWTNSNDQQAIADATNRIERELQYDADKKGTELGKFRVMSITPIAVLYHVSPGDCMVRVIHVRRT